jgi:hypothetical protein
VLPSLNLPAVVVGVGLILTSTLVMGVEGMDPGLRVGLSLARVSLGDVLY